jgi:hypothetical protein
MKVIADNVVLHCAEFTIFSSYALEETFTILCCLLSRSNESSHLGFRV